MTSIGAVVVAYKSGTDLLSCCEALAASDLVGVIVVVNNDPTAEVSFAGNSASLQGKVHILQASENLGYAGGNNTGIKYLLREGVSHILVCNPDVVIPPTVISKLLKELRAEGLALISPGLNESKAGSQYSTLRNPGWDLLTGRGVLRMEDSLIGRYFSPTFFGACFLAESFVFTTVGLLSPNLFLYCEEIDFCLRLRDQSTLGWKISESVSVAHGRGTSVSPAGYSFSDRSSVSVEEAARSSVIISRSYWPALAPLWTVVRVGLAFGYLVKGRPRLCLAVLRGLARGFTAHLAAPETVST